MTGGGKRHAILLGIVLITLTACSSVPPPPPVDPLEERITILQKQLLELQAVQNETRQKLNQQTSETEDLSAKVNALEERQAAAVHSSRTASGSRAVKRAASEHTSLRKKKKTAKKKYRKKRSVRRHAR